MNDHEMTTPCKHVRQPRRAIVLCPTSFRRDGPEPDIRESDGANASLRLLTGEVSGETF